MPANAPVHPEDLTMSDVEAALELSADDPDAQLPPRLQGALRRAAIAGATTGLAWGARPDAALPVSVVPESALEIGSVDHDDFAH